MQASAVRRSRIAPSVSSASAVAALFVDEYDRDAPLVSIPRPEIHLVARFGPSARGGLDVHVMGARQTAHRKAIRGGQRAVTARLHLGAPAAVFGAPASALAGRIV
ncbi:MAG: transcriptional regulator, AraC family, partial [Myxococcaceae bacterium]|nr:transcriptional regulator, AraC family [Myxococcaceae bacterium]